MARQKSAIPKYSFHKASGQAAVYVDGKTVYLGKHDSPESRQAYGELLARLAAESMVGKTSKSLPADNATVAELCLKFVTDELPRYSRAEQHCQRTTLRLLNSLFGETPVRDFGPLRLRVVRQAMIDGDANAKPNPRKPWSRKTVNRAVKRIQALFRFGVSWQIVPESVAAALGTLRTLSAGETPAVDYAPRKSVPQGDIDAVREELLPRHRDIFDLLLLTAARPGELLGLRMKDIDRTGDVWRTELIRHKTAAQGKRRVLFFNSAAQVILMRHFKADPDARLFPLRRDNFGAVIHRACRRAGVTPFVVYQLRHTTITRIADECGVEAAQRVAGHADAGMTEHYARMADRQAVEAVKRLG